MSGRDWVRRTGQVLEPNLARVAATLFTPGHEMAAWGQSRAGTVMDRVAALTDAQVTDRLTRLRVSYSGRHQNLEDTWLHHYEQTLGTTGRLEVTERVLLTGACFTQEYSLEGAALFNPSITIHPDQTGVADGEVRFVMSLRAVGEGHISSVEFRTGTVDDSGAVKFDPVGDSCALGDVKPGLLVKSQLANQALNWPNSELEVYPVLARLSPVFTRKELETAVKEQNGRRKRPVLALDTLLMTADCAYTVDFPKESKLADRVLLPRAWAESKGLEDVRITRMETNTDTGYAATYTAYNGTSIAVHLLKTEDFTHFTMERLSGPGAENKGLALFGKMIDGKYAALSRADRQSNSITYSHDLRHWQQPRNIQEPAADWEAIQLGNCGPPILTDAGWLVLTHGVGPMREYSIGALLLDEDNPQKVLGRLEEPLLVPEGDERNGYVPNVVYSCGSMIHAGNLILPYGASDSATRIAVVGLDRLLEELTSKRPAQ